MSDPKLHQTTPKPGMAHIATEALIVPQPWADGGRVHNWRNYIGGHVRAIWDQLSDGQKVAIAWNADEIAGREEWE